MSEERSTDKVRWFNDVKGYGFITPDDGDEDLFVHQSSIRSDGFRTVMEGESVKFFIDFGDDGKTKVVDVPGPLVGNKKETLGRFGVTVAALDLEVDGEAVIGGMEAVPVVMSVIVAASLGTWLEIAVRAVQVAELVAVLLVVGMATWQGSALMGLAVVVEVATVAAAATTSVVHLGIWRGTVHWWRQRRWCWFWFTNRIDDDREGE